MDCIFKKPIPIEVEIRVERDAIVGIVTSTLHKMAEARFDGQNTQYVNNMQPEVDFEQDRNLVYGYFYDGVSNIVRRIEPYVVSCDDIEPEPSDEPETDDERDDTLGKVFHLALPENWRRNQETVLQTSIKNYLVHYIISQWLEKVSISDTQYTTAKANKLLGEIKWTCELRKGNVHRIWNGTY